MPLASTVGQASVLFYTIPHLGASIALWKDMGWLLRLQVY